MKTLGWIIQDHKCRLEAQQEFNFLRWRINSKEMNMKITQDRQQSLIQQLQILLIKIRKQQTIRIRQIASIRGKLIFLKPSIPKASFHIMIMNQIIKQFVNNNNWKIEIICPKTIIPELQWWITTINLNIPINIKPFHHQAQLTSDASKDGWGGTFQIIGQKEIKIADKWRNKESNNSSNFREISAIYLSLLQMLPQIKRYQIQDILVQTDNQVASYNINRRRANWTLAEIVERIIDLTVKENLRLRVIHLPGVLNHTADSLSRLSRSGDYGIKKEILQQVLKEWNIKIEIDAFANRKNRKTRRFYTVNKDKWAEARDGLSQNWTNKVILVHPPIPLIPKSLAKIKEENTTAIVIVPIWEGQYWWPMLQELKIKAKVLGKSQEVLEMGAKMKKRGLMLPPGEMGIFLITKMQKENNYSENL
ncbi:MAG: putative Pol polyprotein [Streblomastix strix]|uniref:Putative Pol polyprotein n=1 Tax=Streblomastix strix TaxID=222440 RepID=A0A5J4W580_9EUKA|nr:MAG: putative Pol polyprotein [Streblomastix strix]